MLAYLGRYTHRVAIANSRLVSLADGKVTFRWRDYRHGRRTKLMTLEADEFIRRVLLHTLPDGFHRIRHYGFLANGQRAARLASCRLLLAARVQETAFRTEPVTDTAHSRTRVPAAVAPWSRSPCGIMDKRHPSTQPGTTAHECLSPITSSLLAAGLHENRCAWARAKDPVATASAVRWARWPAN